MYLTDSSLEYPVHSTVLKLYLDPITGDFKTFGFILLIKRKLDLNICFSLDSVIMHDSLYAAPALGLQSHI